LCDHEKGTLKEREKKKRAAKKDLRGDQDYTAEKNEWPAGRKKKDSHEKIGREWDRKKKGKTTYAKAKKGLQEFRENAQPKVLTKGKGEEELGGAGSAHSSMRKKNFPRNREGAQKKNSKLHKTSRKRISVSPRKGTQGAKKRGKGERTPTEGTRIRLLGEVGGERLLQKWGGKKVCKFVTKH